ncbi:N-acetyltransferase 8-like 2 [Betta splendens]|uniref:N-acetyltransferase 8-like 2 n=1 Tax=Betta splendens TaxID=158456 RepID=A0A6P7MP69_BETSP|nr:N-acetyltransferase 8-like 2 [Betta splendens]
MQLVIRRYRSSDKEEVLTLFKTGILEHIGPCFYNAVSSPLYIGITLTLCVAGYLLASVFGAVALPAVWLSLIYYCCYELFACYVRKRLQTDMQDIPMHFLSRPDDCFWVAEAEVNGKAQILGTVAVVAKQSGKEKYGELFRMIISPLCRRMGLGVRLTQTALDFCKEQNCSKVVLATSSTQVAAVALYKKMGFTHIFSHTDAECPFWVLKLARVTILTMERHV